MRDQLILRLTEQAPDQVSWLRLSDSTEHPEIKQGHLKDVASVVAGAQVVVIVPSNAVWLGTAKVPTQNKQRLLKAVPYAVEEELASDVEQLHFAVEKSLLEGHVNVAAVERQLMDNWQNMLSEAGLAADFLISDLMAVGVEEDAWSLVLEGNVAMLRGVDYLGFVSEIENLEVMLPLALKEQSNHLPSRICVWHDVMNSSITPIVPEQIKITCERLDQGLLGLIAKEGLDLSKAVNFLQGEYSRREQLGKLWRPWRYVAALAAVLFVLQLGVSVSDSAKLESDYLALKAEAKAIYKDTFPEAKRIVNVKAQMQQKLAALKGSGVTKEITFLDLLADSGMVFKQTSGLVLKSIRYKKGVLDVELEVPSLHVLDQLKQKLTNTKGLQVEIQSAASRKNIVQGRLQIKGAA